MLRWSYAYLARRCAPEGLRPSTPPEHGTATALLRTKAGAPPPPPPAYSAPRADLRPGATGREDEAGRDKAPRG